MMRSLAAAGLAAALIAAAPQPPTHSSAPKAAASVGQWKLVTDQLNANLASGAFSAPTHVTMTRSDGSVIQADRATGNYKQHRATLFGHVSIHDVSGTFGLNSAQGTQASSRGPATLTADELRVNDVTRLYDASGDVHFTQGDTDVRAKTAHLNDATHVLTLDGNVHVVQADRTLDAAQAVYNTQTGSGEASNNVLITFQGVTPSIATPKPIEIKSPKIP